jgi:hypothetical protein
MSETRFVDLGPSAVMLWCHDRNRGSVQRRCATCDGKRDVSMFDRDTGFCVGCLDRSRVVDADDIGGES